MPVVLVQPSTSGSGVTPYPGGPALVTDFDVGVNAIGPSVHLFKDGPIWRVQHFGWVALIGQGFMPGMFIGPPAGEVGFWAYVDFAWQDVVSGVDYPYPTNALAWSFAPGCNAYLGLTS